jgi:hypothetical protein
MWQYLLLILGLSMTVGFGFRIGWAAAERLAR